MYESSNKKVQEIVRVVQLHSNSTKDKEITLNDLDRLCQDLNRSDREEIADLIGSIMGELEYLYTERQSLDDSIKPLEAVKDKLAQIINVKLD
jgi:uncharacterized protein involved in exopolysaccharide biosynthesis